LWLSLGEVKQRRGAAKLFFLTVTGLLTSIGVVISFTNSASFPLVLSGLTPAGFSH
jgi:hypothetical protein